MRASLPAMSREPRKATPRVREHVDKLREAGLDTQKFFDALVGVREDSGLPRAHREAIYKLIAMESFVWYMEALRDERIDRQKMTEEVNKLGAEYDAAIRKKQQGDKAAALVQSDIGAGAPKGTGPVRSPGAPRKAGPRTATARKRPPGTKAAPRQRPAAAKKPPTGKRPSGAATTNERKPGPKKP